MDSTLINGRTIAEILAMVSQEALLYLEAAKDDHATMAAVYEYEVKNKCRYPVYHPVKIWRDAAAKKA
jgi:NifU-like protein involved in Fe-S cluster formation